MKKVSVKWLDAADREEQSMKDVLSKPLKTFGVERTSIGLLVREDKTGVLLITDYDEDDECQTTFIPKKMLIEVK